ncbi:unnamed protein product [Microthlaspi erraticum]|uniref:Uncharacterized protein n=1 Tax=Microthlaspi erraticum TaxID=1685480 RepID=A0A6D2IVA1_9BRAS|nr:unnamed protein product [Microthlaspi erraticum]
MVEENQAMQGREGLRCKPIWKNDQRMEDLMQRSMSTLRKSLRERLREERRTKKRNDPLVVRVSKEFEIGVNLVQEEEMALQ